MFMDFILERVAPGKEQDAETLLAESFAKQAEGSFDLAYAQTFAPRMLALLRPECVEEVQQVMQRFGDGKGR